MDQPTSGSGDAGSVVMTEDLQQHVIRESTSVLLRVPRSVVVVSVVSLVGAVALGVWIALRPDLVGFVGFAVALVLWPALVLGLIRPVTRRHVIAQTRAAYPMGATISAWIDENGVELRIGDREQRIAWAQVASAEIWPATVFLAIGRHRSAIPRTAFTDTALAALQQRLPTTVAA